MEQWPACYPEKPVNAENFIHLGNVLEQMWRVFIQILNYGSQSGSRIITGNKNAKKNPKTLQNSLEEEGLIR